MDLVDLHRAALDAATALLRQVTDAQLSLPTPCTAWDVRALVQHMVAGNWMAVALLAGSEPDRATDHLAGNTAVDAYRASADAATTAFAEPGALARSVLHPISGEVTGELYLGFRLADQAAHVWDLARACGLVVELPTAVCEAAIDITRQRFGDGPRPLGMMEAARFVAADAEPADRMAGFLGRRV